jgi:hypothetical protein
VRALNPIWLSFNGEGLPPITDTEWGWSVQRWCTISLTTREPEVWHRMSSYDPHVERARQIADAIDSPDRENTLYEQFYAEWKAWEAEDLTRGMKTFDRAIGRGNDYTGRIVRFVTGGARERQGPFGGAEANASRERSKAKRVLRESEPEQIQALVDDLPDTTVRKLGHAVERAQLSPKHRVRRDEMEREEASIPAAEWKNRQAAADELTRPIRQALSGLAGANIIAALEVACDEVHAADFIDPKVREAIDDLTRDLLQEADIKVALAGLEEGH